MNAQEWLAREPDGELQIGVLGAPISKASISPSEAWSTPTAFREALRRFPTWNAALGVDLAELRIADLGDIPGDRDEPDATAAHERIREAVLDAYAKAPIVVVIGGDNSLTRPAVRGAEAASRLEWGVITLDAHHDCRPLDDGPRNGTPIRQLIEGGMPGDRVAQVGIHAWGNSRENGQWAADQGVHVHAMERVAQSGAGRVVEEALHDVRDAGATAVWADLDIDVLDRAFAPACPASMPGGMTPQQLMDAAARLGRDPAVLGADLCEVDANADVAGMTVRAMAGVFLSFCAGVALRHRDAA
jgi:formiminoglutamase